MYREVQHGGSQGLASLIKRKQKGLWGKGGCLFHLKTLQVGDKGWLCCAGEERWPTFPNTCGWNLSVFCRLMFWTLSLQLVT